MQESDATKRQQLCRQETNLELDFLGQETITQKELIPSIRNLFALGTLYRSVVSRPYDFVV